MLRPLAVAGMCLLLGGCDQALFSSGNSQDVTVAATEASPDSTHVGTVYYLSGGGAAGWCYQHVGVRRTDQPFAPNVGIVFTTRCSGVDVSAGWQSPRELRITYSRGADVRTRHDATLGGAVQITYQEQ